MAPFLYTMSIREYTNDDLKSVFQVYTESCQSSVLKNSCVQDIQEFDDLIKDEELYVYEEGGRVAAFVSIYPPQSFIHHLYVLPVYQKRGIAKALISHLRNKFELPLSLKCESNNEGAISFYKKTGWKLFNSGSEIDGTEYILMTLDFD